MLNCTCQLSPNIPKIRFQKLFFDRNLDLILTVNYTIICLISFHFVSTDAIQHCRSSSQTKLIYQKNIMSTISKLKHSRKNWKNKSMEKGEIVRYQRKELIRIKNDRDNYKEEARALKKSSKTKNL